MHFVLAVFSAVLIQIPIAAVTVLLPTILEGAKFADASSAFFFYTFFVLAYATAAVILIGIPLHLYLHNKGVASLRNLAFAGIGAAVSVQVVFFFPVDWSRGYSFSAHFLGQYRDLVVDGMPTIWGWLSFGQDSVNFAIHGAVGAVVYGIAWRRLDPERHLKSQGM